MDPAYAPCTPALQRRNTLGDDVLDVRVLPPIRSNGDAQVLMLKCPGEISMCPHVKVLAGKPCTTLEGPQTMTPHLGTFALYLCLRAYSTQGSTMSVHRHYASSRYANTLGEHRNRGSAQWRPGRVYMGSD